MYFSMKMEITETVTVSECQPHYFSKTPQGMRSLQLRKKWVTVVRDFSGPQAEMLTFIPLIVLFHFLRMYLLQLLSRKSFYFKSIGSPALLPAECFLWHYFISLWKSHRSFCLPLYWREPCSRSNDYNLNVFNCLTPDCKFPKWVFTATYYHVIILLGVMYNFHDQLDGFYYLHGHSHLDVSKRVFPDNLTKAR